VFVLGIDPGLTRCGYACVEGTGPSRARAIAMGVIRTAVDSPLPQRLLVLRDELRRLIAEGRDGVVRALRARARDSA